jgi:hypothetical protein
MLTGRKKDRPVGKSNGRVEGGFFFNRLRILIFTEDGHIKQELRADGRYVVWGYRISPEWGIILDLFFDD